MRVAVSAENKRNAVEPFGRNPGELCEPGLMRRATGLKELVQFFNCACDAWMRHKAIEKLGRAL